jgi:hypothetical protein
MSQENVEIVRRVYEKWWAGLERDDPGAVFRATFVYTIENGRITRLRMFQERDEALEAAGLEE